MSIIFWIFAVPVWFACYVALMYLTAGATNAAFEGIQFYGKRIVVFIVSLLWPLMWAMALVVGMIWLTLESVTGIYKILTESH